MSIEKRLTDHMAEQSEQLSFPGSDPNEIIQRPPAGRGRMVTTLAALAVVVAAGIGFWTLSQGDDSTEVAAGEGDDQAQESDDGGGGQGGAFVGLTITDVTDENSPGSSYWPRGVVHDQGIYYVLSTAPGRIDVNRELSDDEWNTLYRANTFYTLADGNWQANELEDRFVSDFEVESGVIYVLSTGGPSGVDTAAYGTSADQGRSWDWQPLDDLPFASQVAMTRDGDATVILANRWGSPGYEETIRIANEAGVDVNEWSLRNFDSTGLSYLPIDSDDQCAVLLANYGLADMAQWYREADGEEREAAMEEIDYMLADLQPQLDELGCAIDLSDLGNLDDIDALDLPEPVVVTWEDLGVTVPERWKPWSGVFRYEAGQLTELDLPFGDQQVGYLEEADGQLTVMTYPASTLEPNELVSETRWTTSDGVNWESHELNYEDEEGVYREENGYGYGPGYLPPVAGNVAFQTYWIEPSPEQIEAYEAQTEAYERGDTDLVDEAVLTEIEATQLRRSIDGGPWEAVEPADLFPDIDLGGRILQQVQGSSYGVFLTFTDHNPFGPPSAGQLVVYSNNGTDWGSFETAGEWLDMHDGDGSILAFDHHWIETENGGRQETTVLELTPAN